MLTLASKLKLIKKMKKSLLLSIASLMAITMSSQDVIVTHDSKRIDAVIQQAPCLL